MTRSCASSCPAGVSRVITRTGSPAGLEKACTMPGGTTTDSPGPRSRTARPTRTRSLPSITSNVSCPTRCQWAGRSRQPGGRTASNSNTSPAVSPPVRTMEMSSPVGKRSTRFSLNAPHTPNSCCPASDGSILDYYRRPQGACRAARACRSPIPACLCRFAPEYPQRCRRFTLWLRSRSVTDCGASCRLAAVAARRWRSSSPHTVTWRHPRRRRRRYRSRAGPGCRGPGHTESWCAGPRATPPLAHPATALRHPGRP